MHKHNRRTFLKASGMATAGLVAHLHLVAQGSAKKPNVLFIVVDDLRPQLGCYGKKRMMTPNIDRLAGQGLLFERTYCQQSVCDPSQASLLSGPRPDSIGQYKYNVQLRDDLTMPEHFKNNGYETISLGKTMSLLDTELVFKLAP